MKVHKHFYKAKEACKPHAAKVVIELLFNCGEAAEKMLKSIDFFPKYL